MQPGDVVETWADVSALEAATGWRPQVRLEEGLGRFVRWWRDWDAQGRAGSGAESGA
jgi:UDP-glucuronate 4-epimerase